MRIYQALFIFLLLFSSLSGKDQSLKNHPYISASAKSEIKPFLLPQDHPLKPSLDHIFHFTRATLNPETFAEAGFTTLYDQPRSFIKVARHPWLPGYLVKAVLDNEIRTKHEIQSWQWFVRRCIAAKMIQKNIQKLNSSLYCVPKKFIYVLPPSPDIPPEYSRQLVILLAEEQNLVSKEENLEAWKTKMTPKHLDELYYILTHIPELTLRPDNIFYTHEGKFAFVDTEYQRAKPCLAGITAYLSPEMQIYWSKLKRRKGYKN